MIASGKLKKDVERKDNKLFKLDGGRGLARRCRPEQVNRVASNTIVFKQSVLANTCLLIPSCLLSLANDEEKGIK